MDEKINQKIARITLAIVMTIMLIGVLHQSQHESTDGLATYVTVVAISYIVLTLVSLWLIAALKGWLKVFAVLTAIVSALVAGWNIFAMILLGSS